MKYEAILLDLDGTLLYTLEDLTDSINFMLDKYGFETHSMDDIRRFVGNGLKKLVERALPDGKDYEKFDEFFNEFVSYYNCHNLIKTRPYPEVIETITALDKMGVKMAIVTNKGQTASDSLNEDFFAPAVYPILYNFAYLVPEAIVTVIVIMLPPVKKGLARVAEMADQM